MTKHKNLSIMTTTLKPLQIENLQHSVIDKSMSGNAGLAIVDMRRKGIDPTNELYLLNEQLVQIELKARREMKKALIDFFETLK